MLELLLHRFFWFVWNYQVRNYICCDVWKHSLKVEPIICGVWVCQSHMSVIISQQSLYLHVCCYAGTMAGGSTPFSWQESNQVSALIWVSLLSSAEPWGIQLLSHYAIHLRLYSANVCVAFPCQVERMRARNISSVPLLISVIKSCLECSVKCVCCSDKELKRKERAVPMNRVSVIKCCGKNLLSNRRWKQR